MTTTHTEMPKTLVGAIGKAKAVLGEEPVSTLLEKYPWTLKGGVQLREALRAAITEHRVLAKQAADANKKADEIEAARAEREAMEKPLAEIETLGKEIAARVKLMHKYEAAAEDKAKVEIKNAQDQRDSITKMLADAKEKCKAAKVSFKKFQATYCPELGRTRLYELLAIGSGKKTQEEVRADTAARTAKSRADALAAEGERVIGAANAAMAAVARGNSVSEPEPGIVRRAELGNEEDRQKLVNEYGWQQSEVDGKPLFTPPGVKVGEGPQPELEMMPEAEQSSFQLLEAFRAYCALTVPKLTDDDALSFLKAAADQVMPRLNEGEASKARVYVCNLKMWEKARAKLQASIKKAA